MTLKNFWSKYRRLILISIGVLLVLLLLVFLSARPWRLAASVRDLEDLAASFERSYPCHEDCLVKRMELEKRLVLAIQAKQPAIRGLIEKRAKDSTENLFFRRSLDRIIKSSAYEND